MYKTRDPNSIAHRLLTDKRYKDMYTNHQFWYLWFDRHIIKRIVISDDNDDDNDDDDNDDDEDKKSQG